MARLDQLVFYLPNEDAQALKQLSSRSRVPMSGLLRYALELLFAQVKDGKLTIGIGTANTDRNETP